MGLALLLLPMTAEAGFEIRGAGIPQPPPMSGGAIESDSTLAPIGMMPDAAGRPTIPVTAVPIDAPAPVDMQMAGSTRTGEQIDGFGTDLPLVIALQQVAPPGYQFAFADAVDPGTRVSWQGGRPWRDVVRDMLAALDLTYNIRDGNVLEVMPQAAMPVPLQTAQVTPAPMATTAAEEQQLRRRKPSSLMDRVKSKFTNQADHQGGTTSTIAATTSDWDAAADEEMSPPPPMPAPLQADTPVVEPMPSAPVPVADALTLEGDLSPIELTARPPATTAAVVRPPAPSTEATVSNAWQGRQGDTLRDVIGDWSRQAGVDLHWSIDYDYRLSRDIAVSGGFTDAVTQLLDQFKKAKPRPYAQLHRQAGSAQVLVIKAYGVNE